MKPRVVGASEFKARCLALLDEVYETGAEIVVTKRGRPVARVVPAGQTGPPDLGDSIQWQGDIESPIEAEWTADPP